MKKHKLDIIRTLLDDTMYGRDFKPIIQWLADNRREDINYEILPSGLFKISPWWNVRDHDILKMLNTMPKTTEEVFVDKKISYVSQDADSSTGNFSKIDDTVSLPSNYHFSRGEFLFVELSQIQRVDLSMFDSLEFTSIKGSEELVLSGLEIMSLLLNNNTRIKEISDCKINSLCATRKSTKLVRGKKKHTTVDVKPRIKKFTNSTITHGGILVYDQDGNMKVHDVKIGTLSVAGSGKVGNNLESDYIDVRSLDGEIGENWKATEKFEAISCPNLTHIPDSCDFKKVVIRDCPNFRKTPKFQRITRVYRD